jgi:5'-methylthioadenosine phosphorylase
MPESTPLDQLPPAIGIIGGSGLYEMPELEVLKRHHLTTPYGSASDDIVEGMLHGRRVCFLARHGRGHRLLAHEVNHRANIWAMRALNVRWMISVTAVGSLREDYAPRHVVVPDQLIDRTGRAHEFTFFGQGISAHISFSQPYSAGMRAALLRAAAQAEATVHDGGTYLSMNGPAFSTVAEAQMHRQLGAAIIGMTNAPEALLCREAEIAQATLALVTDYDCWRPDEPPVDVATVVAHLSANSSLAQKILKNVIAHIPEQPDMPEHRALAAAILTPRELWPAERVEELRPLLPKNHVPSAEKD